MTATFNIDCYATGTFDGDGRLGRMAVFGGFQLIGRKAVDGHFHSAFASPHNLSGRIRNGKFCVLVGTGAHRRSRTGLEGHDGNILLRSRRQHFHLDFLAVVILFPEFEGMLS